ncbi:Fic family protein [Sediminicola luteus]|uniref:Cell filamentation protein Fic n=1 Tax=Sediminicola luteus TaxID=319238 RepID=A0A2A4GBF3_9FLAO|nr:Fic family protein [Sediminicola luteus]PCE65927.1 cell filamentation protein Fic [Sediminicola luteus]
MIEKAPSYQEEDDTISIMVDIQLDGVLKTIQDEYLYWDKVKYREAKYPPNKLWNAVKFHRRINANRILFGRHSFSFVVTDYMLRALHRFDMHIGGTLGSNIGIPETEKNKFIISSLMEESISSSQMEGANTTRKKAKEMIRLENKPKTKSEMMIMNNFVTMKHIVQHKSEDLTPANILYIHQLITNDTLDIKQDEGRFRVSDNVHVVDHVKGEIVHTPPGHKEIMGLIEALCEFFNSDSDTFIHPIIKGCIIHFMVGWIHPFVDGNGRTARALYYWFMLKKGYWLTEYLSISRIIQDTKNQYEKSYLYTETDENDLGYFITYHIKTMEKAYEALIRYIDRKRKEVYRAAKYLKIPGINERMAQILKLLHEDPDRILTNKGVSSRFNVSDFTARTDLKMLVELGFLDVIQVNKKKRNFVKSDSFERELQRYNL